MARASRHTQPAEQGRCRRTQPADNPTGTGLEETQQPAVGRPRSKTTAADDVGQPLAVQCRLVEGVRWCWPLRKAGSDLPTCLPPTYRFCLSTSLPTPLICKKQFSTNFFYFTSPFKIRPLTPFIVCVRLTYPVTSLLPTPTFPSRRGIREG